MYKFKIIYQDAGANFFKKKVEMKNKED